MIETLSGLLGPVWRLMFYTDGGIAWIRRTPNKDGSWDTIRLSQEACLILVELMDLGHIHHCLVEGDKTVVATLTSGVVVDLMKPSFELAFHMCDEIEAKNPGATRSQCWI